MKKEDAKLLLPDEWKILQVMLNADRLVSATKYFREITGLTVQESTEIVKDYRDNGLPKTNILGWIRNKVFNGN